jgi:hypothetical protein
VTDRKASSKWLDEKCFVKSFARTVLKKRNSKELWSAGMPCIHKGGSTESEHIGVAENRDGVKVA